MQLPSKVLDEAIEAFAQLPGIGRKSALRMVLHLLKTSPERVEQFGEVLIRLRKELRYCQNCHNISGEALCSICSDQKRDASLVCVVEDIRDVMAIENTLQYKGHYHVLGGLISPMDGIGPSQLNIDSLCEKTGRGEVAEVIAALSTTMEGDTTLFYLYKKLKPFDVKMSTLARGVAIGGALEYADEVTLGRSIINRVPYDNHLVK
ncbi:MAG: recombination protein RecR [Bacteroidetes bacterium]|nr:recombination protein RecR [Bacteroidota bacterium]